MKVLVEVECKVKLEVEFDFENPDSIEFAIEENSCPGTGVVGAELEKLIEHGHATATCWACGLEGKNRILSINGQPLRGADVE